MVTFSDAASLSIAASFDSVGSYVLILSASDGQLSAYDELTVTVEPSPQNHPTTVSAGPDLQGIVGTTLIMNGAVLDDGLPDSTDIHDTINWTQLSGPAPALIDNDNSAGFSVEFSEIGTYTFELSSLDGEFLLLRSACLEHRRLPRLRPTTVQIADSEDDAEESAFGSVDPGSTDMEFAEEKSSQIVGLRVRTLPLPNGSIIKNAHIQFTADEDDDEITNLIIQAESVDDSALFTTLDGSLSSRTTTLSSVTWSPDAWRTPGGASETQSKFECFPYVNYKAP